MVAILRLESRRRKRFGVPVSTGRNCRVRENFSQLAQSSGQVSRLFLSRMLLFPGGTKNASTSVGGGSCDAVPTSLLAPSTARAETGYRAETYRHYAAGFSPSP